MWDGVGSVKIEKDVDFIEVEGLSEEEHAAWQDTL